MTSSSFFFFVSSLPVEEEPLLLFCALLSSGSNLIDQWIVPVDTGELVLKYFSQRSAR